MSLNEFFNMGGYAFYVWTSYGIALLVLVLNLLAPLRQRRKLLADIARTARRARRGT
jgi:heme exporter protein D